MDITHADLEDGTRKIVLSLEDLSIGGRGIHLMRSYAWSLTFQLTPTSSPFEG